VQLELRPWRASDSAALHAALAESPDLATQFGEAAVRDVAEAEDVIAHMLGANSPAWRNITISDSGIAVGNLGISNIEYRHGTAWVSYWLRRSARGRGLATRGLATVAAWAFEEFGLFRLELGHRLNNPASCRVASVAGFTAEGIERAKLRYGTQRFDVETHARLATDPAPVIELIPLAREIAGR